MVARASMPPATIFVMLIEAKRSTSAITLRVRDLGPEPALATETILESRMCLMLTPRERPFSTVIRADNKSYGAVDFMTPIDWSNWTNGRLIDFESVLLPCYDWQTSAIYLAPSLWKPKH